jgi:hypothetical protein
MNTVAFGNGRPAASTTTPDSIVCVEAGSAPIAIAMRIGIMVGPPANPNACDSDDWTPLHHAPPWVCRSCPATDRKCHLCRRTRHLAAHVTPSRCGVWPFRSGPDSDPKCRRSYLKPPYHSCARQVLIVPEEVLVIFRETSYQERAPDH